MSFAGIRSQVFHAEDKSNRRLRVAFDATDDDGTGCTRLGASAKLRSSALRGSALRESGLRGSGNAAVSGSTLETEELPEPVLVYDYSAGGSFGELALLFNCPRAATIECTQPGILWAIGRQGMSDNR